MPALDPLISVIFLNYNHGRFVGVALRALLAQTYRDLEILFVDDGSTDGSRKIVEQIASTERRIRPVYFDQNQGIWAGLSDALSRARGDLLYWAASDDYLTNDRFFEHAVFALKENPSAGGCYGLSQVISFETDQNQETRGKGVTHGFIEPKLFFKEFLRGNIFVPGNTAVIRRELLLEVGGYDAELGPLADFYVNNALGSKYGLIFLNEVVGCARISDTNQTYSSNSDLQTALRRWGRFEKKMRAMACSYDEQEEDWKKWQHEQASQLALRFSRVQRSVTRIKEIFGDILPVTAQVWLTTIWRHTARKGLLILTAMTPAYRRARRGFRH